MYSLKVEFIITTKACPTRWVQLHELNDTKVSCYVLCLHFGPLTLKALFTMYLKNLTLYLLLLDMRTVSNVV